MKDCACHCGSRHPNRQGICTGREDEQVKVTHVPPLSIPMCGPCALAFVHAREREDIGEGGL